MQHDQFQRSPGDFEVQRRVFGRCAELMTYIQTMDIPVIAEVSSGDVINVCFDFKICPGQFFV